MTSSSFCADISRQLGEDLIGYGIPTPLYVLIECPRPWAANALDSPALPQDLQRYLRDYPQTHGPIRPLLICNRETTENKIRVMIFRQPSGFARQYQAREFQVESLEAVLPRLQAQLSPEADWSGGGDRLAGQRDPRRRDILVCTHGRHDRCCARYGKPFYRQVCDRVAALNLPQVAVWEVSHIGCHRFAPTLIDLPSARYYGRLTLESFTAVLTRSGTVDVMTDIYRGWGLLPNPAQAVERELILRYGWDWFDYQVKCRLLNINETETACEVELQFQTPTGEVNGYRSRVMENGDRTLSLIVSCGNSQPSELAPFEVKDLEGIGNRE